MSFQCAGSYGEDSAQLAGAGEAILSAGPIENESANPSLQQELQVCGKPRLPHFAIPISWGSHGRMHATNQGLSSTNFLLTHALESR